MRAQPMHAILNYAQNYQMFNRNMANQNEVPEIGIEDTIGNIV